MKDWDLEFTLHLTQKYILLKVSVTWNKAMTLLIYYGNLLDRCFPSSTFCP